MELTKTKLNKILKKYRVKLEQHNKEWEELCRILITAYKLNLKLSLHTFLVLSK